jgi:hypothetical protein
MAHIDGDDGIEILLARQHAQAAGYVVRAKLMLLAAGIAAFGIVAVAATMVTTLL